MIPAPLPPMLAFTTTGNRNPFAASTARVAWLMTRDFGYVPPGQLEKRLQFMGTLDGLEVYEDLATGKTVYIGRSWRGPK